MFYRDMLEMQRVELFGAGLVAVERNQRRWPHFVGGVPERHVEVLSVKDVHHAAPKLELWESRVVREVH